MNLKEIKEMIALMNENNLTELELERDGLKISLKKTADKIIAEKSPAAKPPEAVETRDGKEKSKESGENFYQIISPMVGTFYQAPSPDADPFVEAGEEIKENQVVCIIEAMKLMNEIKSDVKGKIVEILVKNGEAVEFGQPLFNIEKT
ncbi:MAG: acetyl-CoA carboxylase biotin carboxyl carrier protein [Candidatus Omnitrophota bacterium]|nr:acetyl-CoA carboxylase biotin carboxyl carrier protein [Candidatus Omnitrophota bacterium]